MLVQRERVDDAQLARLRTQPANIVLLIVRPPRLLKVARPVRAWHGRWNVEESSLWYIRCLATGERIDVRADLWTGV